MLSRKLSKSLTQQGETQLQDAVPGHCSYPNSGSPPTPSDSQGDNITLPLLLPARVISHSQQTVCPPDEVQETATNT